MAKVSGGREGSSGSLEVNVNTFKQFMKEGSEFMSEKTVLSAGGPDLPEPIRVKLLPIYKAVHYDFFKDLKNSGLSGCDSAQSMAQKSENVKRILEEYPKLMKATRPEGKISHKLKVKKDIKIRGPFDFTQNRICRSPYR